MKYIYMYRMTSDTGSAPCIFENDYEATNLLTLACCKGGKIYRCKDKRTGELFDLSDEHPGKDVKTGLRHTIGSKYLKKDDEIFVVGIYKSGILYVAQITEVMTMKEYYSDKRRYSKRLDFIYDSNGNRNKNNKFFHPKNDLYQHRRDWNGEYVLLSNNFSYNGEKWEENSTEDINKKYLPKNHETKVICENETPPDEFKKVFNAIKCNLDNHFREGPICQIKKGCKGCNQK